MKPQKQIFYLILLIMFLPGCSPYYNRYNRPNPMPTQPDLIIRQVSYRPVTEVAYRRSIHHEHSLYNFTVSIQNIGHSSAFGEFNMFAELVSENTVQYTSQVHIVTEHNKILLPGEEVRKKIKLFIPNGIQSVRFYINQPNIRSYGIISHFIEEETIQNNMIEFELN